MLHFHFKGENGCPPSSFSISTPQHQLLNATARKWSFGETWKQKSMNPAVDLKIPPLKTERATQLRARFSPPPRSASRLSSGVLTSSERQFDYRQHHQLLPPTLKRVAHPNECARSKERMASIFSHPTRKIRRTESLDSDEIGRLLSLREIQREKLPVTIADVPHFFTFCCSVDKSTSIIISNFDTRSKYSDKETNWRMV